ncbi:type I secretion system permease/ATPase [Tepidamorphus sp. 3E244]|uniref:type I secretion system permease/ATPase n=1 Tax=Tepidamorphus sp. 3E244 TaxID=3385498 RepID=UPI0038FC5CBF
MDAKVHSDDRDADDAVAENRAGAVADPLLDCLAFVARRFGMPFSPAGALSGLPLENGRLDEASFPRAAARFGFSARTVARSIYKIPDMVLPAIVLLQDGEACVVTAFDKRRRRAKVYYPENGERERTVDVKKLAAATIGAVIYITPESAPHGESFYTDTDPAQRRGHWFFAPVRQAWGSWLQVVFAALMVNLLGLAVPFFIMNVYDRVIPNLAIPTLFALSGGVVIALVFDLLLRQVRASVLDRAGRRLDMGLAAHLFDNLMRLRMSEHRAGAGVLASQVREFDTVREVFTSQTVIAITDFLFIGIFVFAIWTIVGPIAWVPILAIPVVLVLTLLIRIPLARAIALTQDESNRRHGVLVESLTGVEAIRAANAEGVMQRRWEDAVAGSARAGASIRMWSALVMHLTTLVQQSVGILIIVWGVFLVADGEITVGALIATNILAGRVLGPLANIAMTLVRAQQGLSALRSLNKVMKLPTENAGRAQARQDGDTAVELRDVAFAYPGAAAPALRDLNLKIQPGERMAIIGRIGSGKSTIGKLFCGFYEPTEGSVIVGGSDTRAHNPADLRSIVGYVGQSAELFSGTLRDNIVMGRPQASDEEIANVVQLTGIDRFSSAHPLGLMMPIGERGLGLSGGQKQAVAMARVLIRDPAVLFLDEPSSALDTSAEQALVNELKKIADTGRTLIVCTHSGALLSIVDRVVLLEQGKIVADGPRDEVIALLRDQAAKRQNETKRKAPVGAGNP